MSKPVLFAIIACLVGGAAFGFLTSTPDAAGEAASRSDRWDTPKTPIDYSQSASRFRQALITASMFPEPRTPFVDEALIEKETAIAEAEGPPFPQILSVARIDGIYTAQVRRADGKLVNATVGDQFEGGWQVLEVSMNHLSAERDGVTTTLTVSGPKPPEELDR
ncbi:hypothetical protein RYZ27_01590 [Hyphomonas sp. FCG-A18]|uniref:hypothetical protein n=1 Tax=Hyphomonas sp. FCG-A18 TaxID=3080019 RepID=UPI002B2EC9A4|nr:hypothetical protein RYZ27_01590 [Hyphomonas sp. FCG-A18]